MVHILSTAVVDIKIVLFPVSPAHVLLKGPTEARVGDVMTYECVTANSNPPALIQWFVDNQTVPQIHQHTHTVVSPQGGMGHSFQHQCQCQSQRQEQNNYL